MKTGTSDNLCARNEIRFWWVSNIYPSFNSQWNIRKVQKIKFWMHLNEAKSEKTKKISISVRIMTFECSFLGLFRLSKKMLITGTVSKSLWTPVSTLWWSGGFENIWLPASKTFQNWKPASNVFLPDWNIVENWPNLAIVDWNQVESKI